MDNFTWDIADLNIKDGVSLSGGSKTVDGFIESIEWYLHLKGEDDEVVLGGQCNWSPEEVSPIEFKPIDDLTPDDVVKMVIANINFYADPAKQKKDDPVAFHSVDDIKANLQKMLRDRTNPFFKKLKQDGHEVADSDVE
mgnify:CR=1 FL=1